MSLAHAASGAELSFSLAGLFRTYPDEGKRIMRTDKEAP